MFFNIYKYSYTKGTKGFYRFYYYGAGCFEKVACMENYFFFFLKKIINTHF